MGQFFFQGFNSYIGVIWIFWVADLKFYVKMYRKGKMTSLK